MVASKLDGLEPYRYTCPNHSDALRALISSVRWLAVRLSLHPQRPPFAAAESSHSAPPTARADRDSKEDAVAEALCSALEGQDVAEVDPLCSQRSVAAP